MLLKRFILTAAAVALSAGASATAVKAQQVVTADGSSTVFPITEAAAEAFQKENPGIRVTVAFSGSTAGFRKFCNGEIDIVNSSKVIGEREIAACRARGIRYIELPVAFDALTVVVNPQNTWATNLTTEELKAIWEPNSRINNWNQVRQGFPNQPLRLFGAGAQSGTFEYFTEAINGRARASRTDYTPSEDDNVLVQGVVRDRGAMGYFGLAYYEENKARLRAVSINGVEPTIANVKSGRYKPLARPLFIYVNADSAKRPEVARFVSFYLRRGSQFARKAGYVSFPDAIYARVLSKFTAGKLGTAFGGKAQIGVSLEELLTRDTSL
ncbi:MAG: PstS family phosphate ABC transporter substrate-binding protein [Pseudanabaenaceae cyanobacterium]